MDIDLRANGLRIQPGMPFEKDELRAARVSKAGFFIRLSLPKITQAGDIVYWAKNPALRFFGGKVIADPEQSNSTTSAFRSAGSHMNADLIFGTSVFLCFNGGHLRLAIAQVIMSFTWAQGFTDEFREAAVANFGDANCSDLSGVPRLKGSSAHKQFHLTCSWTDGDEFLVSRLSPKGDTSYVSWGQNT